jgi:hypothetical protein
MPATSRNTGGAALTRGLVSPLAPVPPARDREDTVEATHVLGTPPPHDEVAQRAMEAALDVIVGRHIAPLGDLQEAERLLREALDRDPRTHGTPQSRIHWLHIKDGDKMVWQLVGELHAMHRDVDGLIAFLADRAGVEAPTSARLQKLRDELRIAEAER